MKRIEDIRSDFPILERQINGKPLIYFDNAATSQTPEQVVKQIAHYYHYLNANVHRGVHTLSQEATDAYENARQKVQKYLNAKQSKEVIFTSGTTQGINLVARGLDALVKEGDEIWVSQTEHHSNIVPWQMLCERTKAVLRIIPITDDGQIDRTLFEEKLTSKAFLICCQHVSNALGTIHPISDIIQMGHSVGAMVLIDGAQASSHIQIDVQSLGVDFYLFSAHKMYGPTGAGVLYGKKECLEKMEPYQGGGEMIKEVTFEKTTYADLPYKFEPGTPNICGVIALGFAIDYINSLGVENIAKYEHQLLEYATEKLKKIEGVRIYGVEDLTKKTAVISFTIDGIHSYDMGTLLDKMGIAVRTGHHCAQPTMDYYHTSGTVRASFAVYNTFKEIDAFIEGVKKAQKMLS